MFPAQGMSTHVLDDRGEAAIIPEIGDSQPPAGPGLGASRTALQAYVLKIPCLLLNKAAVALYRSSQDRRYRPPEISMSEWFGPSPIGHHSIHRMRWLGNCGSTTGGAAGTSSKERDTQSLSLYMLERTCYSRSSDRNSESRFYTISPHILYCACPFHRVRRCNYR